MKLYTEKEVRNAIKLSDKYHYILDSEENEIINALTPIELPSDEEVGKKAEWLDNPLEKVSWKEGAIWMRDKIQGGNK